LTRAAEKASDRHRARHAPGGIPEGVTAIPIVTLSHEIGAGGPEIGQKLAERLSLHYVDQELISQAALRYGLREEKLFSSLDESKPSLFERFDAETRSYITVLQTALYEFAEQDRVVLMGRAGQ
jgi:hypothetical protein